MFAAGLKSRTNVAHRPGLVFKRSRSQAFSTNRPIRFHMTGLVVLLPGQKREPWCIKSGSHDIEKSGSCGLIQLCNRERTRLVTAVTSRIDASQRNHDCRFFDITTVVLFLSRLVAQRA